jgi:hypothetical protein
MIVFFRVFSLANTQTAKVLLDRALVKKEQQKFLEGIKLCDQAIVLDSILVRLWQLQRTIKLLNLNRNR